MTQKKKKSKTNTRWATCDWKSLDIYAESSLEDHSPNFIVVANKNLELLQSTIFDRSHILLVGFLTMTKNKTATMGRMVSGSTSLV